MQTYVIMKPTGTEAFGTNNAYRDVLFRYVVQFLHGSQRFAPAMVAGKGDDCSSGAYVRESHASQDSAKRGAMSGLNGMKRQVYRMALASLRLRAK